MAPIPNALRLLFCATLAAAAAACGGGGDEGPAAPPPPAPAQPAAAVQGFWSGRVDAQTTVSAVVLPEGPVMAVFQTGALTTLVMGTATVAEPTFSIAGRSYNLSTSARGSYAASGTVVPRTALNVAASGSVPAYSLAYNRAYETPASLPDAVGRWRASFSGGTLVLTLDVAANGAITGSNTSGCSYGGTLVPHAGNVAVFGLQLTEACAGVPAVPLSGIATLNEARTVLAAAFASPDGANANAFQAVR